MISQSKRLTPPPTHYAIVRGTAALPLVPSSSVPHVPVKKSASKYRLLFSDYQAVYNPYALIPHQMKIDTQLRMIPAKVFMNWGWSDTSLRQNPYKQFGLQRSYE
jgi:hypothetical protein